MADGVLYVSWNGVTEVRSWVLETGDKEVSFGGLGSVIWKVASRTEKNGFETKVEIPNNHGLFVRIVGVDGEGKFLGATKEVSVENVCALRPSSLFARTKTNILNSHCRCPRHPQRPQPSRVWKKPIALVL
jgi:hypothetical protein